MTAQGFPGSERHSPDLHHNVLFLLADGYVDRDVHDVGAALEKAGFALTLGGIEAGETVTSQEGRETRIERGYMNLDIGRYDLVIVPRGANVNRIIEHKSMINVVYTALHKGRVIATIGPATAVLVPIAKLKSPNQIDTGVHVFGEDVLKGRRIAVADAVEEDIEKAGAIPVTDQAVVSSGPIVTATDTDGENLHRFVEALIPRVHKVLERVH